MTKTTAQANNEKIWIRIYFQSMKLICYHCYKLNLLNDKKCWNDKTILQSWLTIIITNNILIDKYKRIKIESEFP